MEISQEAFPNLVTGIVFSISGCPYTVMHFFNSKQIAKKRKLNNKPTFSIIINSLRAIVVTNTSLCKML